MSIIGHLSPTWDFSWSGDSIRQPSITAFSQVSWQQCTCQKPPKMNLKQVWTAEFIVLAGLLKRSRRKVNKQNSGSQGSSQKKAQHSDSILQQMELFGEEDAMSYSFHQIFHFWFYSFIFNPQSILSWDNWSVTEVGLDLSLSILSVSISCHFLPFFLQDFF